MVANFGTVTIRLVAVKGGQLVDLTRGKKRCTIASYDDDIVGELESVNFTMDSARVRVGFNSYTVPIESISIPVEEKELDEETMKG